MTTSAATADPTQKLPAAAQAVKLIPGSHHLAMPPAWRWQRAGHLLDAGRPARRGREDPWVAVLRRFRAELSRCYQVAPDRQEYAFLRLREKYPALYEAWTIHLDTRNEMRWKIEAYLCAAAAPQATADRLLQHPETVAVYAQAFFDVVGKTRHWGYMLAEVFSRSIHLGLADRDYDLLWKLWGLLRGPLFLDSVILHTKSADHVTSRDRVDEARRDLYKSNLGHKALQAAGTMPVAYNQEVILAAYNKLVEIEQTAEGEGGAGGSEMTAGNIQAALSGFYFAVSRQDSDSPLQHGHYLQDGRELRAAELVAQTLGAASARPAPKALAGPGLAFPEPRVVKTGGGASEDRNG